MKPFGREDSTTEFKLELNDKLEKEVVGFLNSKRAATSSLVFRIMVM
jgi:hypothetical protein